MVTFKIFVLIYNEAVYTVVAKITAGQQWKLPLSWQKTAVTKNSIKNKYKYQVGRQSIIKNITK